MNSTDARHFVAAIRSLLRPGEQPGARELEAVFLTTVGGLTYAGAAERMGVAEGTISEHRQRLAARFGVGAPEMERQLLVEYGRALERVG